MSFENYNKKTIVAIATPSGYGGVAIIRISGVDALKNSLKILNVKKEDLIPQKMILTSLKTKAIKDEVMAVYFKAPKSYTGEDVIEIHCHANPIITSDIIEQLINDGCFLAENGEFTKRAFLNGRIDLSAAESVIDIINAQSRAQVNSAYEALKGETYKVINNLQNKINEICGSIGACIDYPEEGLEEKTKLEIKSELNELISELEQLKIGYNNSRLIKEGVRITIAGEPNSGKSTLLNTLIGYNRAIVTEIEGTTRDTIEEKVLFKDLVFVFTDTAGIRETNNKVEKLGIQRSHDAIKTADIVLLIKDYFKENSSKRQDNNTIEVFNKIDVLSLDEIKHLKNTDSRIYISAEKQINTKLLMETIYKRVKEKNIVYESMGINNARQLSAVNEAIKALINAKQNLDKVTFDFILSDINEARRALGQINGKTAQSNVIDNIFSRFCVGK